MEVCHVSASIFTDLKQCEVLECMQLHAALQMVFAHDKHYQYMLHQHGASHAISSHNKSSHAKSSHARSSHANSPHSKTPYHHGCLSRLCSLACENCLQDCCSVIETCMSRLPQVPAGRRVLSETSNVLIRQIAVLWLVDASGAGAILSVGLFRHPKLKWAKMEKLFNLDGGVSGGTILSCILLSFHNNPY